ncbi:MAG: Calx-beta domain-containing protein, partial [Cyanobacteria bacterium J06629_2]
VTVDFSTLDNVAIAGQDYEANSGTLVFASEEKEQTIEVDIIDNNLSRDEDFKLQLSNPSSNATIADDEGVGTIIDSTLEVTFADGTAIDFQLASYPPDSEKDPDNLPFEVSSDHNSLTITGDGDGWKEIPLTDNLDSRNSPLKPYTVIEFDFKTTEAGKLHGLHFESRDHHDYYAPWEKGRFFQLYGSSEFGIQDFNDYQDSLGEWKTYQIPVGQFIDNTVFHDGEYKAVQWLAFAHEGNSEDSNSQFRNLKFQELLPISVAGVAVNEGDGTATFTLTIPEASDSAITLDYATTDGTAIAEQDYIAAQGNVTFAPGETSQTIEITVNDDGESEGEESFSLSLSNVNQAIALESAIIATITDNDEPLPVISVENISFAEGNLETSTASVTVNLDKPAAKAIAVNYSTEDNTAIAEQDYQAVEGTVTFAPGETSQTINLALKGDVLNETDESFWLNLADATNATLATSQAEITINNDDALPNITVSDAGILASIPVINNEGSLKNSTGLTFAVTLDAPSNQTVKVDYATVDGTAIAEEDYQAKDKTLTFQPGETEKTVFVGVVLDETAEADEELFLVLSNPENATIADELAVGTIEETRSLFVKDLEISEAATEAIFTVSLDQPSVQGTFVSYATEDGTAKAGADYTETKGRLFIKAGEASATVTVPLIDNNLTESDETFSLNLTKPKYVKLGDARAKATILNDDAILSENPGGIYQNLQLWIKPDAVEATGEQKVTRAIDHSQLGLDLVQTTVGKRPIRYVSELNYNPVLRFDGEDVLETVDTLPADFAQESSVFVVTKSTSSRNNFLFTLDNTGSGRFLAHMPWNNQIYFDSGNTSTGRLSLPYADSQAARFNTWHFSSDSDNGQEIFRNGLSLAAEEDTGTPRTINRKFQIGRQFQGDIAEVIVFNQALSQSDRLAVDSYLGIKYGFTIDQTIPTDYVNSDGAVIWDAIAAADYKHDIAGIIKDKGSGLNQIQSRSSNNDAVVTISNLMGIAS